MFKNLNIRNQFFNLKFFSLKAATAINSPHAAPAVVVEEAPSVQVVDSHGPVQVAEQLVGPQQVIDSPAVQVAEQLVAPQQQIIENHAAPISTLAVSASRPAIVEAPAQLIKTYATSIYGPSLLTDNIIFSRHAAPIPSASYEPPINNPAAYAIPSNLQTSDGSGYYEPTLVYSNPTSLGYLSGTNVGSFGYELAYRKKKKK